MIPDVFRENSVSNIEFVRPLRFHVSDTTLTKGALFFNGTQFDSETGPLDLQHNVLTDYTFLFPCRWISTQLRKVKTKSSKIWAL